MLHPQERLMIAYGSGRSTHAVRKPSMADRGYSTSREQAMADFKAGGLMTKFRLIPSETWRIKSSISGDGRARLLGESFFPQIVEMICDQASLLKIRRE
jgi:hypothetical protein